MTFAKKILLCVDLNEESIENLKDLRHLGFLNEAEVHLAYAFQTTTLSHGFWDYDLVYPVEQDRDGLRQSAEATLANMGKEGLGPQFKGKIVAHCLFGDNPKHAMSEFIGNKHIDLVIMWAREKRGLFDGSFSNYVNKHTKANVLILKRA